MTLCVWSAKQTIPLSVLARNQTKGLDSRSPTRPEVVGSEVREKLDGAVGKGTQKGSVGKGRRREAVDNGQQQEAVRKTSQRWVGIPSGICRSFAKNTLPTIICKMHEKLYKKVSQNYPSCSWSWPKSILFVCSFSPTPSVVFLVAVRKCVIPLSEPTRWITCHE